MATGTGVAAGERSSSIKSCGGINRAPKTDIFILLLRVSLSALPTTGENQIAAILVTFQNNADNSACLNGDIHCRRLMGGQIPPNA